MLPGLSNPFSALQTSGDEVNTEDEEDGDEDQDEDKEEDKEEAAENLDT